MLVIPVVKGNINKALKQFKIKFKKTGVLKELKERKRLKDIDAVVGIPSLGQIARKFTGK